MAFQSYTPGVMLVAGQVALVVAGLAALALSPPASGRMLLIPMTERGRAHLLSQALGAGASLIARGPIAGSYVVYGERARIAPSVYADGVLALAGSAGLCGATA